jgi:hypothetical protein
MKFFSFCCDIFSHFELSPTWREFSVDIFPSLWQRAVRMSVSEKPILLRLSGVNKMAAQEPHSHKYQNILRRSEIGHPFSTKRCGAESKP